MNNKTIPYSPSIETLVSLSETFGISILPEHLAAVELHTATLTEHAANVMAFKLDNALDPAPRYKP